MLGAVAVADLDPRDLYAGGAASGFTGGRRYPRSRRSRRSRRGRKRRSRGSPEGSLRVRSGPRVGARQLHLSRVPDSRSVSVARRSSSYGKYAGGDGRLTSTLQSAVLARFYAEFAAVDLGHRADDREAEPGAGAARVAGRRAGTARPALGRVGGDQLAAVGDRTAARRRRSAPSSARSSRRRRCAGPRSRRGWRPAAPSRRAVARAPAPAAGRGRIVEPALAPPRPRPRVEAERDRRGQVDRLVRAAPPPSLRASMQQRLDQPLAPLGRVAHHARPSRAARSCARVGIGQRHVDLGADDGQRRAQLVRGVGDEPALRRRTPRPGARASRRRCRPAP